MMLRGRAARLTVIRALRRTGHMTALDIAGRVPPMSQERGTTADTTSVRPAIAGALAVLLVLVILRLVILLGWRDGGSAED
jgi:hypothetical protein